MDEMWCPPGAFAGIGHGKSPSLRSGGFLDSTTADIVEALTSGKVSRPSATSSAPGTTPAVRNPAELPEFDRQAIAVYLPRSPASRAARGGEAVAAARPGALRHRGERRRSPTASVPKKGPARLKKRPVK